MTTLATPPPSVEAPDGRSPSLTTRSSRGMIGGLLRTARPHQWVKQALLLAAPAAGGVLLQPAVWGRLVLAVLAFCLAASATYLVNDALDAEQDRRHPTKRYRPIAAGAVTVRAALLAAAALALTALAVAAALGASFLGVLAAYLALTAAYSTYLKHRAVLDIVAVSGGFVLRAVAGGVAAGVVLSQWFLMVALFGSLVLVAGKRRSEQAAAHRDGSTRAVLAAYPPGFLDQVLGIGVTATLLSYAQWSTSLLGDDQLLLASSLLPVTLALLRHLLLVHRGQAEAPERLLMSDRPLQLAVAAWLALVLAGTYL